jgi:outer membrane murein-binding lipoprotein Lpp
MTRKKLADLLREEQGKNTEPSVTTEEEVTETASPQEVETLHLEIAQLREQLAKREQEKKAALETAANALKDLEKVRKEALELAKANTKLLAENATLTKEKPTLPKVPETEQAPHWEQKPSRVVSKSLPPLVSHNNENLPTWLL